MLHIIINMVNKSENVQLCKRWRWLSIGNKFGTLNAIPNKPQVFTFNIVVRRYHKLRFTREIKTLSIEVVAQGHAM